MESRGSLIRRGWPALVAVVAVAFLPGGGHAQEGPSGPPAFKTKDQKMLYHWGTAIADELANVGARDPAELEWIFRGMRDRVAGKSPPFTTEELNAMTNYLLNRIEKNGVAEAAQAVVYVRDKGREPGAVVTKSGLVYRPLAQGKGAQPGAGAKVKVAYEGRLRNGWVFDSSRQRGGPLETSLQNVIPCWKEAIPLMRVGGKASITCPPGLAYGDNGTNNIPPGSALTFQVELLAVVP